MSNYVVSYLTDATLLKKVYGAKNLQLIANLTHKLADELDDLNDEFENETTSKANAAAVLADIINAEVRFEEITFMYTYVYEKICKLFGKQIFPPNDEYSTPYYHRVIKENKAFFPLPFSLSIPLTYSIAKEDLEMEKAKFLGITATNKLIEDSFTIEKEDYAFIFNKAITHNKDLVFFVY